MVAMSDMLIKIRLFLCSYVPLFLISGIRFETPWLSRTCYALAFLGVIAGLSVVHATSKIIPSEYLVTKVEDQGAEVSGYVATYLLPFVTVSQPSYRDLIGYGVFLLVIAILYVRSEMIQINPTLYFFRWRVLSVATSDGLTTHLLTQHDVRARSDIRAVRFKNTLLIQH